jgi:hypothetical protein
MRYVLPSTTLADERTQTFEFPVQALSRTKPAASVVVTGYTFHDALSKALEWARKFSETQHLPLYPRVKYSGRTIMVKKLSGPAQVHAYIENSSHAKWVPVAVLSL